MQKPIKDTATEDLERELARSKRILGDKQNLMPQSVIFYTKRRDMIAAEIERRTAAQA